MVQVCSTRHFRAKQSDAQLLLETAQEFKMFKMRGGCKADHSEFLLSRWAMPILREHHTSSSAECKETCSIMRIIFVTVHGVNSDRGGYPYPPRSLLASLVRSSSQWSYTALPCPVLPCSLRFRFAFAFGEQPTGLTLSSAPPALRSSPAESQDEIRERISKLFSLGLTYAARYENHK